MQLFHRGYHELVQDRDCMRRVLAMHVSDYVKYVAVQNYHNDVSYHFLVEFLENTVRTTVGLCRLVEAIELGHNDRIDPTLESERTTFHAIDNAKGQRKRPRELVLIRHNSTVGRYDTYEHDLKKRLEIYDRE